MCLPQAKRARVSRGPRSREPALEFPGAQPCATHAVRAGGCTGSAPKCEVAVLTLGSICSGIGTCHRAAARVNACNGGIVIRSAFACEVARSARKVLAGDFPFLPLFADVGAVVDRLPSCDVLVAGFPCQPFSQANRRRKGSADARCDVIQHILHYIERVMPRLVLLENVIGLLSFGQDAFLTIARRLQAAGFSVAVRKLRSDVHGGVPQCRRRLYIVAARSPSAAVEWPTPVPARCLPSILADDFRPPGSRPSAAKAAAKIDAVEASLLPSKLTKAERCRMVVNCHSQRGNLRANSTPCLTAARGAQGGFWLLGHRRMMSVCELLRLQGIDPASTCIGTAVSARQAGALIGNAFTLPVIARVLACGLRCLGYEVADPICECDADRSI